MSDSQDRQDIFDVDKIRALVELMHKHDLTEINIRQGDMRIQLRRGGAVAASVAGQVPASSASSPGPAVPQAAPPAAEEKEQEDNLAVIKSPMVGTFYAAPDPNSPPYVQVGDIVNPNTIVCIIEAMKVFNEIPAGIAGKIVAVLVENGEPVEYGQPLFKVDTTVTE